MSTFNRRPMGQDRKDLVKRLIARDGFKCMLCGEIFGQSNHLQKRGALKITIDHKVPKSRGGSDSFSNLQLAHYKCNQSKGNDMPQRVEGFPDYQEFQRYQDKQLQEKKLEDERSMKLFALRAELSLLEHLAAGLRKEIEELTPPPPTRTLRQATPVSTTRLHCASDAVILKFIRGMNGAKFEQINQHVITLGYQPLAKGWMLSLLHDNKIYNTGKTRNCYWFAR